MASKYVTLNNRIDAIKLADLDVGKWYYVKSIKPTQFGHICTTINTAMCGALYVEFVIGSSYDIVHLTAYNCHKRGLKLAPYFKKHDDKQNQEHSVLTPMSTS